MENSNSNLVDLGGYRQEKLKENGKELRVFLKVKSKLSHCPHCNKKTKTVYEFKFRDIRHSFWFDRPCILVVKQRRFKCKHCKIRFWERLPGIAKYSRRTETFRKQIAKRALEGHDNKLVAKDFRIGQSTVLRDIKHHSKLELKKKQDKYFPTVLGIDEHHFSKKKGFATTFCDLRRRKIFDVRLGRYESSLGSFLANVRGKERTKIVVMDLSSSYRDLIQKYIPWAKIIADRFHVVRLALQKFVEVWKSLDPSGRANRGLVSLFRRHKSKLSEAQEFKFRKYLNSKPGLEQLYDFKNEIHDFLRQKNLTRKKMKYQISRFMQIIQDLKASKFNSMITLANTFESWQEEILRMLRFSRSNGITEGFHNKMEKISRIAYGFRNFNNYRERVLLQCA